TASDGANGDALGGSVAISGSTIVAGAPDKGTLYVFSDSSGVWRQTAELTATGDALGEAVAISGSTIVAGAPQTSVDSNSAQGAVDVFSDASGAWQQTARLTASDG